MAADPTSACPARDVEELLAERGILDHVTVPVGATVHPELMEAARACRHSPGDRVRRRDIPEVDGQRTYLYRAIDQCS
jgi:transposase-like protein